MDTTATAAAAAVAAATITTRVLADAPRVSNLASSIRSGHHPLVFFPPYALDHTLQLAVLLQQLNERHEKRDVVVAAALVLQRPPLALLRLSLNRLSLSFNAPEALVALPLEPCFRLLHDKGRELRQRGYFRRGGRRCTIL